MIKLWFLLMLLSVNACARDLMIGDSLVYEIGNAYSLKKTIHARYLTGAGIDNKINWNAVVDNMDLKQYRKVYICIGTNDMITADKMDGYQKKAESLIDAAMAQNRNVIWILPPVIKNHFKNKLLNNTRSAIEKAAATRNIATFDIREITGNDFVQFKGSIKIRTEDGVHITPAGAEMITESLF